MGMSVTISVADQGDAEQILKLQYLCYQSEAELYGDWAIDPLTQSLDSLREELAGHCVLVARLGGEVVGSVRGRLGDDGVARVGRLVVHPRMQRHGLGSRLLQAVEERLAESGPVTAYRLITGHRSLGSQRLYRRLGYREAGVEEVSRRLSLVILEKPAVPAQASAPGPALAASA
ncbi:GNAT family N-acetyltransferase [Streptacidiphilus sp. ASG 303]|uniref:GNAT family N-acetyltransferase n=1 Tax=Streptacidiphilus sp. ASG 303 TaxID=2896847 RepID=UPI001E3A27BC|nr:GNAT family N-acetyltransferase [Streptacidiphilus sp. ASG 303]MCD0481270.1 GNAT family N-acetyltransferase [Streptacidiphilus sp. ASG 303]